MNEESNITKFEKLLTKICEDLKINDYEKIVNCYIKNRKIT